MTALASQGNVDDERADMEAFCADAFPRLVGALKLHTGDVHLTEELTQEAQRRTIRVGGIAAALLLVTVGVLVVQLLGDGRDVEIVGQPFDPAGSSWMQMPSHPVDGRVLASVVWADDRLLVWGGEDHRPWRCSCERDREWIRQDVAAGLHDPS